MTRVVVAVALALAACRDTSTPADRLTLYLTQLQRMDRAERRAEVLGWKLDRAAWDALVVPPFSRLYDAYARGFDDRVELLTDDLSTGAITTRPHFAGDAQQTIHQAWLRWALPTLYPSLVVQVGGAPLDTVFVDDHGHWRSLAGLDTAIEDAVREADTTHTCARWLVHVARTKPCADVDWAIADAALRTDSVAFARACGLAATMCGPGK